MKRTAMAAGISIAALIAPFAQAAAQTKTVVYEIRKDGEPIGRESVTLGEKDGALIADVETHTKARVLFMDFVYDHTRREEWQDGALRKLTARTDDDGAKTELSVERGAHGWSTTVDGRAADVPAAAFPAALWTERAVGARHLFGIIDAAPYLVETKAAGEGAVMIGGVSTPARHYRMTGGLERDLWYGADGILLRAEFTRKGFPIEMIRIAP